MKKVKLYLMAVLAVMCINSQAQTIVDIGKDYAGGGVSETIQSTSGVNFASGTESYPVNQGTDNEVNFVFGGGTAFGANDNKSTYKNTTSGNVPYVKILAGANGNFFEGFASMRYITEVKLNGTTATVDNAETTDIVEGTMVAAVVFSDQKVFDVNSITGHREIPVVSCRAGNAGVTISDVPAGTRSFRIYNPVVLSADGSKFTLNNEGDITIGDGGNQYRLAYAKVVLGELAEAVNDNDCNLLSLSIWGKTATIEGTTASLTFPYAWESPALNAIPVGNIAVSPQATADIAVGGTLDFSSGPVKIKVTSGNGANSQEYTVNINFEAYVPTENDFAPVLGKSYRIVNKASGVGGSATLEGEAKYFYFNDADSLRHNATPEELSALGENANWQIIKTSEFTYSIRNVGKNVYLSSAGAGTSSAVTGSEVNENYLLVYRKTENEVNYYIIASPTPGGAKEAKQIRAQSNFTGWYWDAGVYPNERADMLFAFEEGGTVSTPEIRIDKTAISREYFDLMGKSVSEDTKGFIIEKVIYEDGTTGSKKLFVK